MSEHNPKTGDRCPEDDLSFPPPLAEHAQYLVLANEFLAQDDAVQEIFAFPYEGQPDRKRRARTKALDEAA